MKRQGARSCLAPEHNYMSQQDSGLTGIIRADVAVICLCGRQLSKCKVRH